VEQRFSAASPPPFPRHRRLWVAPALLALPSPPALPPVIGRLWVGAALLALPRRRPSPVIAAFGWRSALALPYRLPCHPERARPSTGEGARAEGPLHFSRRHRRSKEFLHLFSK